MLNKTIDFFAIEDKFKDTEHVSSIPVFENKTEKVPLYTIAIPTYKRVTYLKEALESALNQDTSIPYEVIIVDNNPERNDETEILLNEYCNYPNLIYFKNRENIGMVGNFNRLYTLSRTKWVIMLHDDDLLLSDYISSIDNILKKLPDSSVIYPSFCSTTVSPKLLNKTKYIKLKLNDFVFGNIIGPPLGMCFKREDFFKIGGFRDYLYPSIDYDIYVRAIYAKLNCYKIFSSSKAIYRIEVNESLKPITVLGFIDNQNIISNAIISLKKRLSRVLYTEAYKTAVIHQYNIIQRIVTLSSNELSALWSNLKKYESIFSRINYTILRIGNKISIKLRKRYIY